MKPLYENIFSHKESSIHAHKAINKFLDIPWHYHPEIEITHIHNGTGKRYIGTSISRFQPGEVALIGPNIPHLWVNDKKHYQKNSKLEHEDWVIQFREDIWGEKFLDLPEMFKIKKMLSRAQRGLVFSFDKTTLVKFLNIFEELINANSFRKIPLLIEILGMMTENENWEYLNSKVYNDSNLLDSERMQKVFKFVTDNFREKIKLEDAAKLIPLSPSGFSRYFKKTNDKTFFEYVNDVRIELACRLLLENDLLITQICYECGFNNFSNFSRHFKKITGYSPLKYRKMLSFKEKGKMH